MGEAAPMSWMCRPYKYMASRRKFIEYKHLPFEARDVKKIDVSGLKKGKLTRIKFILKEIAITDNATAWYVRPVSLPNKDYKEVTLKFEEEILAFLDSEPDKKGEFDAEKRKDEFRKAMSLLRAFKREEDLIEILNNRRLLCAKIVSPCPNGCSPRPTS